jgi:hypothetical protein
MIHGLELLEGSAVSHGSEAQLLMPRGTPRLPRHAPQVTQGKENSHLHRFALCLWRDVLCCPISYTETEEKCTLTKDNE